MKINSTSSFDEAARLCKPFSKLQLPQEARDLLNSGKVLFYFSGSPPAEGVCYPSFPINPTSEEKSFMKINEYPLEKARRVEKSIKNEGVSIPIEVKVIVSVQHGKGEIGRIIDNFVTEFMLDCIGHTLLYLLNPKARNECDDSMELIENLGINYLM